MDLPEPLLIIHQPTRLRMMGLLHRDRDIGFAATRDALGLTDGNLASHAKRLEEAGYLEARRVLHGREGFELRYRITPAGSRAFGEYLGALRVFLEAAGDRS